MPNLKRIFFLTVLRMLPLTRAFALKRACLKGSGFDIAGDVRVVSTARFLTGGNLVIGEGSWIGHDFLLVGGQADVQIGANCDIGPRVTIAFGTHVLLEGEGRAAGAGYSLPVEIGDGCWIGTGATVLGGTVIGNCSVVAAGAVLRGVYPDRVLIGGTPARVIRTLAVAE